MLNTHWFQEALVSFEWLSFATLNWLVRNVYCLDFLTFSKRKHLLRNGLWDSADQMCHLYSVNICIWANSLNAPCSQGRVRQQRWIPPCVCTAKAEFQNTTYPSCGHPLTLDVQRSTGKNYKTYPGDFHTVLDVIFRVLIQFRNKALICTFSCVYLPPLQQAQNKEILNIYWLQVPINLSFSHFYDVSDVLCLFSIYYRLLWINFICCWHFHHCSVKIEI